MKFYAAVHTLPNNLGIREKFKTSKRISIKFVSLDKNNCFSFENIKVPYTFKKHEMGKHPPFFEFILEES